MKLFTKNVVLFMMLILLSSITIAQQNKGISSDYTPGGPTSTDDSNVELVSLEGEYDTSIEWIVDCDNVVTGTEDLIDTYNCQLEIGGEYTLSVKFGTCAGDYEGGGAIWIDWNNDFEYDVTTEFIGISMGAPGTNSWNEPVEFTFTVPEDAVLATTGMRIMQQESLDDDPNPYSTYGYGSMADYGLVIVEGTSTGYQAGGPTDLSDSNVESVSLNGANTSSIEWLVDCDNAVTGTENLIGTYFCELEIGAEYTVAVKFGTCGGDYEGGGAVWIDWNNNYVYDNVTELIGLSMGNPGTSSWNVPVEFTFTVPEDAVMATTGMRVMQEESLDDDPNPYSIYGYGSMADFGLVIIEAIPGYQAGGPTTTDHSNIESVSLDGANSSSIEWVVDCDNTITGTENLIETNFCELERGREYTLAVDFGTCGDNNEGVGAVWIDWNSDFEYDVATELIGVSAGEPGSTPWNAPVEFTFTVPEDAFMATTGMRIMQQEGLEGDPNPYSTYASGSMTDFGINIIEYVPTAFIIDPTSLEQTQSLEQISHQTISLINGTADDVNISFAIEYLSKNAGPASKALSEEELATAHLERTGVNSILERNEISSNKTPSTSKYQGEILQEIAIEGICLEDAQLTGVEFDGVYLWVSGGGNGYNPNYLYKIKYETLELVEMYEQASLEEWGIRDLAFADGKLYGADDTHFYCFDPGTEEWTTKFESTMGIIRALAYDGTYFWTKSYDGPLYQFDGETGDIIFQTNTTIANDATGAAYDPYQEFLYIFNQNDAIFYQFDLDGEPTGLDIDMADAALGEGISAGAFFEYGTMFEGTATLTGLLQAYHDVVAVAELYTFDQAVNDVAVIDIVSPTSGILLSNEEVSITIKNFGSDTQEYVPFEVSVDGETIYTGILEEPIAPWETVTVSCGIVNFITVGGEWTIEVCTQLSDDQNPSNDCKSATVIHKPAEYCLPSGLECGWGDQISNFILGDISNLQSGCSPNGYGDYTSMSAAIEQGTDMEVSFSSGVDETFISVYIDLNGDWDFDDEGELVVNGFNCESEGVIYSTTINVMGATVAETRLRVITSWQIAPANSCGTWEYGEVEDYTVTFDDYSQGWLTLTPEELFIPSNETMEVDVQFSSMGLAVGTYQAVVTISGTEETLEMPVTLNVEIDGAYIELNPEALEVELGCEPNSTSVTLSISNPGTEDLIFTHAFDEAWLSTPNDIQGESITIAADASYEMLVHFDASDLVTGVYSDYITFTSNAINSTEEIECTLNNTCLPSGILDGMDANTLSIYPNPATTSLHIESNVQIDRVRVYNMVGRLILDQTTSNTGNVEINTTTFESGVYLIQVSTGAMTSVERISIVK